jgi:hypothetical protein
LCHTIELELTKGGDVWITSYRGLEANVLLFVAQVGNPKRSEWVSVSVVHATVCFTITKRIAHVVWDLVTGLQATAASFTVTRIVSNFNLATIGINTNSSSFANCLATLIPLATSVTNYNFTSIISRLKARSVSITRVVSDCGGTFSGKLSACTMTETTAVSDRSSSLVGN